MSFRKKPKNINPNDVDPSVYYYDEVYDDMKNEESAEKETPAGSTHKQSNYIRGLLESAELRKTEKEIRKFKKYAKDREKAEEEKSLNETEVYITSSYKKKLNEMRILDAKARLKTADGFRPSSPHEHRLTNDPKDEGYHETRSSQVERRSKTQTAPSQAFKNLEHEESSSKVTQNKHLTGTEDRRLFLEKVLAKRTIGTKFDEALKRYRQRKDQT